MKKILIGIIIGGIVFGCLGIYGANIYESNSIEYNPTDASWEVNNVNDAINDLYDTKNELTKLKGLGNATASDISDGKTAVVQGELVKGTGSNLKYKTFYCSSRDTTFTLTSGFQPFITCNLAELQGKSVKASWLTIGYSYSSNSCPIYYSLTNSGTTYYINVHTDSTCTGRLYISSPAIAVIYEG